MRQFVNRLPATIRDSLEQARSLGFHIGIITMSAAIALFLPVGARWFLSFWAQVENEKMVVIALEVAVAAAVILMMNFIWYSLRDRKRARLAEAAGLVAFSQGHSHDTEGEMRALQEQHSRGRTVLAIGTRGYGTFVEKEAELPGVLANCLEAKLLLMNPFSARRSVVHGRCGGRTWRRSSFETNSRRPSSRSSESGRQARSSG